MTSEASLHPKVFISYSHDSTEHKERVLSLSDQLRASGVDCHVDQYEDSPGEGWSRWMMNRIEEADFVLIVCTDKYVERFRGAGQTGTGLGAKWEGAIITQELYEAETHNTKFIPVVFSLEDADSRPVVLRSTTYYVLNTKEGYETLYRRLTNQPRILKPELGKIQSMPPLERKQNFLPTDALREQPTKKQPEMNEERTPQEIESPERAADPVKVGKGRREGITRLILIPLLVSLLTGGGIATYKFFTEDVIKQPRTEISSDGKLQMTYNPSDGNIEFNFALNLDNSRGTDSDLLSNATARLTSATEPVSAINSINFAAEDFTWSENNQSIEATIPVEKGKARVVTCALKRLLKGRSDEIFRRADKARLSVSLTGKDGGARSHDFCFENSETSETFLSTSCR
jgi:hypothetical protein